MCSSDRTLASASCEQQPDWSRLVFDTGNVTSMCMKTHHERQKLFDLTMSCSTMTGQQGVHTPVLCHYLICSLTYTSHTHIYIGTSACYGPRGECVWLCVWSEIRLNFYGLRKASNLNENERTTSCTIMWNLRLATLSKPWACVPAQKIASPFMCCCYLTAEWRSAAPFEHQNTAS